MGVGEAVAAATWPRPPCRRGGAGRAQPRRPHPPPPALAPSLCSYAQHYGGYDEGEGPVMGAVGQQALMPTATDPKLWVVRCGEGSEREAVVCLLQKCYDLAKKGTPLLIKAVFCQDHLKVRGVSEMRSRAGSCSRQAGGVCGCWHGCCRGRLPPAATPWLGTAAGLHLCGGAQGGKRERGAARPAHDLPVQAAHAGEGGAARRGPATCRLPLLGSGAVQCMQVTVGTARAASHRLLARCCA